MRKIEFSACLFLGMICGWAGSAEPGGRPPDAAVLNPLVSAALQQDWERVLRWEEQHPAVLQYPVGRAVAAHACLAQNQNNLSFELFSSLKSAADLECYTKWTEGLVADGSPTRDHPVAHYFRGDALARQDCWPLAQVHFTKATQPDGHFALAWSALGVAHAYQDHFKDAKDCFKRATQEDENLADAYANFGTLLLIIESGTGATEKYRQALKESKEFALAANGQECAKVGQSRDPKSLAAAVQAFTEVAKHPAIAPLAMSNMKAIAPGVDDARKPNNKTAKGMSLSANEMRDLDSATRRSIMGNMNYDQLQGIMQKAHENYAHSRSWGESLDYFKGMPGLGGLDSGQSLRHASEHYGVFQDAMAAMQDKFGVSPNSHFRDGGGADTEAVSIANSSGDVGKWPAKATRFGLVPLANLPHVTRPGD